MTDKKTLTARIVVFSLILVAIVILMRVIVRATQAAGKYDSFAQCLVTKGVKFYGAFWCPHCQAQEKALNASRQKLEREGLYVECSTPTQSENAVCADKKIETFPTWTFPNGITFENSTTPKICSLFPGSPDDDPLVCKDRASHFFRQWVFVPAGPTVASDTEPTRSGSTWSFGASSQLRGETSLTQLATLSGCALPSAAAANASDTTGAALGGSSSATIPAK